MKWRSCYADLLAAIAERGERGVPAAFLLAEVNSSIPARRRFRRFDFHMMLGEMEEAGFVQTFCRPRGGRDKVQVVKLA